MRQPALTGFPDPYELRGVDRRRARPGAERLLALRLGDEHMPTAAALVLELDADACRDISNDAGRARPGSAATALHRSTEA